MPLAIHWRAACRETQGCHPHRGPLRLLWRRWEMLLAGRRRLTGLCRRCRCQAALRRRALLLLVDASSSLRQWRRRGASPSPAAGRQRTLRSPPLSSASRNHRTSLRTGAALATCRRHRRARRRRRRRLAGARGVPQRPLARPVRQIRLRRKCRRARRSVSREASPPSVPISPTPRGWLRVDCRRRLAGRRRTSRSTRRESGSMRAPTEVQKANLGGDVAGVLGPGMSECSRACTSTHTVPACVIPRGFSGLWRCALGSNSFSFAPSTTTTTEARAQ